MGPGWISGAADDDPSGIATYSQAGAQFGFTTLWMALFIPLIIATGVANMREHGVATTSTDNIVS